ncbi:MAG: cytochrome c, partial [Telluria sp.]
MRKTVLIALAIAMLFAIVAASVLLYLRPGVLPDTPKQAQLTPTTQIINRGEYLARAGDCVACHTVPNGPVFAGGRAMATPFGNLYVPNITPDD